MTEAVEALPPLLADGADLLVVNACRFRMLDERYTDEQRDEWATEATPMVRQAIREHLPAGRPLLGLHAASICFDDWPEWADLLGGAWQWEPSGHGPVAPLTLRRRRLIPSPRASSRSSSRTSATSIWLSPTTRHRSLTAEADGETHTLGLVAPRGLGPRGVLARWATISGRSMSRPISACSAGSSSWLTGGPRMRDVTGMSSSSPAGDRAWARGRPGTSRQRGEGHDHRPPSREARHRGRRHRRRLPSGGR